MAVSSRSSIRNFLNDLSAPDPVPGGGSAAALAGALGCALGSMVGRILLIRPKVSSKARVEIRRGLKELRHLRSVLEDGIRKDAAAYARLVRAMDRNQGIPAAQEAAIRVPFEICLAAANGSEILRRLIRWSGPYLGSDLQAGRGLLRGAYEAASSMVLVNLRGRKTDARSDVYRKRLMALKKKVAG